MATPAAIGIYLESGSAPDNVRDRSWRGVYHHSNGAPEGLGTELVALVATHKGFIGRVVTQVIDAAPQGWGSFQENEKLDVEMRVAPDDTSSVCFVYVFDVGARR
jgi:hypothetical protein